MKKVHTSRVGALSAVLALLALSLTFFAASPASAQTTNCKAEDFTVNNEFDLAGYLACVSAESAGAQCPVATAPATITPTQLIPGQSASFLAGGFKAGVSVKLLACCPTADLGSALIDANGEVRVTITVPSNSSVGACQIVAQGTGADGNERVAGVSVTLVAASGSTGNTSGRGNLPITGGDTSKFVAVGVALVVLGGAALAGSLRSRRTNIA